MQTGEIEELFTIGEELSEIGLILSNVDYDRLNPSNIYLTCHEVQGDEKIYYLVRYTLDTEEMNIVLALENKACCRVYGDNIYLVENGTLYLYNLVSGEETQLLENYGGWDISLDGTRLGRGIRNENSNEYYIYNLETGETTETCAWVWTNIQPYRIIKDIDFVGNSYSCAINSGWSGLFSLENHNTIVIKEPGKIGRIIFYSAHNPLELMY